MAEAIKEPSSGPSLRTGAEKVDEPYLNRELDTAVDRLNPEQRAVYHDILMNRRIELQEKDPSVRNVSVEERWGLLLGIESGEIRPPRKKSTPLLKVNWEKVRRDFENRWPNFIEKSLPPGNA